MYYAAFLYARDLMKVWGLSFTDQGVHAQVAEGLKCSGLRPVIKIGRQLSRLHDERKHADYDIQQQHKPDMQKVEEYWRTVRCDLASEWGQTPEDKRRDALDKMRKRILTIPTGKPT